MLKLGIVVHVLKAGDCQRQEGLCVNSRPVRTTQGAARASETVFFTTNPPKVLLEVKASGIQTLFALKLHWAPFL